MDSPERAALLRRHLRDLVAVKEVADALMVFYDQLERLWFEGLGRSPAELAHWFTKTARNSLWDYPAFEAAATRLLADDPRPPDPEAALGLGLLLAEVQADYVFLDNLHPTADESSTYQHLNQAALRSRDLSRAVGRLLAELHTHLNP